MRRSVITDAQIEISKRATIGAVSSSIETRSTPGSRTPMTMQMP